GDWSSDVCSSDLIVFELVAKSLVTPEFAAQANGRLATPRYRLLESIRQFAAGRLASSNGGEEARAAYAAHADYYVALGRRAEPELYRERQARWLSLLELEYDNI